MTRTLICICILLFTVAYIFAMSTKPAETIYKDDMLTIFLTGNELGQLQPCGCSGVQLGGFDRRFTILNSVPESKRLIVDTGALVESDGEQDTIKFNIITLAMELLAYDLVNLTEKDIQMVKNIELSESIGSLFNVISSQKIDDVNIPAQFTRKFLLKGKKVPITIASFDPATFVVKKIQSLFPFRSDPGAVNILILKRCDEKVIDSIAKTGFIDCLVCPAESDEPMVISDPNKRPLVISAGRFGKYVGKLEIRAAKNGDKKPVLGFSAIEVSEDLAQRQALTSLYKDYQQLVKESQLLEKNPRFALPDGLEFLGSQSCKTCHDYEYQQWSTKAHAHAYATLEKVGSQYDPQCVLCHVVGMDYESGFVTEENTPHLKNVGCENCHGPGSEHVKNSGEIKTSEPTSSCIDCHTPENSADYAGNEQIYFEKIIHWREPNSADNVK